MSAVIAVACGFGGVWLARAGIAVAVCGGLLAASFAWQEVKANRSLLLTQNTADARRAGDQLHAERVQHVRLLGVLQVRNSDLRGKLHTARAENAHLTQEAARLRGDKTALEFELEAARQQTDAEVFNWPRRVSGRGDADDIWGIDGAPTVVQLQALANPPADSGQARRHA